MNRISFISKIKLKFINFLNENPYNIYFIISLIIFNTLFLIFAIFFHDIYQEEDGIYYFLMYKDILTNNLPPNHADTWPPGPSIIIGLISNLTGDFFLTGKVVMVEFSILFLVSIYLLIKKVFNNKIAFFTYLFIATNCQSAVSFFQLMNDLPFAAFSSFSIYFLYDNTKEFKLNIIYSSIFLGLATMMRWTGLFFIPVAIIKILLDHLQVFKDWKLFKKVIFGFIKGSLLFLIIFFSVISPLLIANINWFGSPFYNTNIYNVYIAMKRYSRMPYDNREITWIWVLFGPESSIFYQQLLYTFFFAFPVAFLQYLFHFGNFYSMWIFKSTILTIFFTYLVIGIVIFGYYIFLRKQKKDFPENFKSKLFVIFVIIIYLLIHSMGFSSMRFLYPVLSLLIAPIIFLFITILGVLISFSKKIILKIKFFRNKFLKFFAEEKVSIYASWILTTLIIFELAITFVSVIYYNENERAEYKIAGEFLRDRVGPNTIVVARRYNYLYYMEEGTIKPFLYTNDLDIFLRDIRTADYLIVCERIEVKDRPELRPLLDPSNPQVPSYLTPIFIIKQTNRRIVIYKIR